MILLLNLDGSKYFKNTEGKYNKEGLFTVLLFEGATQHVGVIVFLIIPEISPTYIRQQKVVVIARFHLRYMI
jgi:hypothetical protein